MKKALSMALSLAMALSLMAVSANAASDEIKVTVNGEPVVFTDVKPFIDENNRTLVPLSAVAEALGLTVVWDGENKIASFSREDTLETANYTWDEDDDGVDDAYYSMITTEFFIGSDCYNTLYNVVILEEEEGGVYETLMDTAAIIKDSRTYAPLRYLAEAFNYDVIWDGATKTINLVDAESFEYYYVWSIDNDASKFEICLYDIENCVSIEILDIEVGGLYESNEQSVPFTAVEPETEGWASDALVEYLEENRSYIEENGYTQKIAAVAEFDFAGDEEYAVYVRLAIQKGNGVVDQTWLSIFVENN